MVHHIMHTRQHRREENLHFSNSFMEKSLLLFLAASGRDHHGLGGTGRCLCTCQKNVKNSKMPAVCSDGAGLAGVSLHRFYLPRFFVCFCACEKLQQTVQSQFKLLNAESERPGAAGKQERVFACARRGQSLFPSGVLTSALADCASAPWELFGMFWRRRSPPERRNF